MATRGKSDRRPVAEASPGPAPVSLGAALRRLGGVAVPLLVTLALSSGGMAAAYQAGAVGEVFVYSGCDFRGDAAPGPGGGTGDLVEFIQRLAMTPASVLNNTAVGTPLSPETLLEDANETIENATVGTSLGTVPVGDAPLVDGAGSSPPVPAAGVRTPVEVRPGGAPTVSPIEPDSPRYDHNCNSEHWGGAKIPIQEDTADVTIRVDDLMDLGSTGDTVGYKVCTSHSVPEGGSQICGDDPLGPQENWRTEWNVCPDYDPSTGTWDNTETINVTELLHPEAGHGHETFWVILYGPTRQGQCVTQSMDSSAVPPIINHNTVGGTQGTIHLTWT